MRQCRYQFEGLESHQDRIDAAIGELTSNNIMQRIMDHDFTVWKSDPSEITSRLGWLDIATRMKAEIPNIQTFVAELTEAGITQILLLGMGGSSLAPELFSKIYGPHVNGLEVNVLDSTDPDMIHHFQEWSQPEHTLFIISTKSGGTIETLSLFKFFYQWMCDQTGQENAGAHFAAITDPGSKLESLAETLLFRKTFLNDPNIGGRFSALSFFGLVPAALAGVDIDRLLSNAIQVNQNLCMELGAVLGELALIGKDKVTFILSHEIAAFGDWLEQLVAESTGKEGKGILPVVNEPLLSPEYYGNDRLFVHIRLENDTASIEAMEHLKEDGHPVLTFILSDIYNLGEQFWILEMATAVACQRLDINPFDQPNVESAKILAGKMVSEYREKGALPEFKAAEFTEQNVLKFLKKKKKGDYVSLQAYIPMVAETITLMQLIRTKIQEETRLAVTVGFGPRFLHSTGQLHKGDAGNGLFIQLTCDNQHTVDIPNETGNPDSDMTFNVLKNAQAMGDFQALLNENRRAVHFHLKSSIADELKKLLKMI